jgi:leader peptidase (prepilin peptidase)/N-methyltransferase
LLDAESVINLTTALWFASVGACFGSFLNVVAYRLPKGLSLVWLPSRCPHCQHPIRAWHNLPVIGWLLLRGRCYDCREPIAPRYAIVEAILGSVFLGLAYVELFSGGANLAGGPITRADDALDLFRHPSWPLIALVTLHCLLATVLLCMALLDYDRQLIPPRIAAVAAAVALPLLGWLSPYYADPFWAPPGWSAAEAARVDGLLGAAVGIPGFVVGLRVLWQGRVPGRLLNRSLVATTIGASLGLLAGGIAVATLVLLGLIARSSRVSTRRAVDRWVVPMTVAVAISQIFLGRQLATLWPS